MSLIKLKNGDLTVTLSTRGAEMQSILDREGLERLWQGDPAYWTGRAPVLFPVCGGLKEDRYFLDGQAYYLPKHGFARRAEWTLETAEEERTVFLLTEKQEGFPFTYELRAAYELRKNTIQVSYIMKNLDSRILYYSIGSHEAYATPGGLEGCTLYFDEAETLASYELDGNLLKKPPVLLAENTNCLPLKTEYFAVDALVFQGLKSRGVTLVNRLNGRRIRVDFRGMDALLLWTKPGAEYFCIEPWCNLPDFANTDQQISRKPGMIRLVPGATDVHTHTITIL